MAVTITFTTGSHHQKRIIALGQSMCIQIVNLKITCIAKTYLWMSAYLEYLSVALTVEKTGW